MSYRVKPPPTVCKVPAMDRKLKNNRQQQKMGPAVNGLSVESGLD